MTTSYQNQCMTGEAIYNNFQSGRGGEGLSQAAGKVNEAKLEYDQLATDIRQLTMDMEAIWQGPSSGAATRGAGPLAVEHELAQPELHNVQDLTTRQVDSYNTAKNSVQPIPNVPEEPGFWDNVWSFGGASDDYEQQVAANRAANDNNVQVMQNYDQASTYNGENMPTQYGQMQPDNSKITVGGGGDDPGGSGDGDRNGGDSVTRPPGSTGDRPGGTSPTGTPTTPSGYTSTTPGGYQPPGGGTPPGGGLTPVPTPYPPGGGGNYPPGGTYPPGTYPPGTYPPGGRPPGGGPGGRPPGFPGGRPPGTPPGTPSGGPRGGGPGGYGPGSGGPGSGGPGSGGPGGMRGGAGSGFGPGGPGAAMGAEDGRAGSGRGGFGPGGVGAGGAAGAGGAGGRGGGMMGGAGGAGARGCEDEEHTRASFLVEDDPDALFGTDQVTAPPVIGE